MEERKRVTIVYVPSAKAGEGPMNIVRERAATANIFPTFSVASPFLASNWVILCEKGTFAGAKADASKADAANTILTIEAFTMVYVVDVR